MQKQVHIKKGQEANRLLVLREFFEMMEGMFETVDDREHSFFVRATKTISKKNFKITLIIEELNN